MLKFMKNNIVINTSEIKSVYREYCKKEKIKFSEKAFKRFIEFLEVDFYDWITENLKQFTIKE